jgi:uncharacterized membrane protein
VAFGGATQQPARASPWLAAATTLLVSQLLQTLMLGGTLLVREPQVVGAVLRLWRPSLFAGLMGAAASAGWFTAFALSTAAHVRTLGLVELVFSYAISLKLFRERFTRRELAGMALLAAGLVLVTLRAKRRAPIARPWRMAPSGRLRRATMPACRTSVRRHSRSTPSAARC